MYGVWGDDFRKNLKLKKYIYFFTFIFSYFYCFIDLKSQSEHSGPRPDTSSFVLIYSSLSKVLGDSAHNRAKKNRLA